MTASSPVLTGPSTPPAAAEVPLPQLHDIHLPDPLGHWPLAPGWWLLITTTLVALVLLAHWAWRHYRHTRYRRAASTELCQAWRDYDSTQDIRQYLQQHTSILKRTALVAFQQETVANLNGKAWLAFLDSSTKQKPQRTSTGAGNNANGFNCKTILQVVTAQYTSTACVNKDDLNRLHKMGLDWIAHHRPTTAVNINEAKNATP